ncbi:SDR family NAD(P)-dependent oxidoreductase [Sporosarcina sp. BI001-red]|uniref:SDR family NAD(P)-dependent oxidoreductase n=1 Tax=Sporosarcina sp. BI001-red TaxID=2282866 RepID=UPI001F176FA1|nr:SDR family NAD(P)-dependent oxidoreductase [Sporosarcina sp. BI001-red]
MDSNLTYGDEVMVEGNVLFITGAARGIGFDIAKAFSEAGAKVVLSDLSQQAIVLDGGYTAQ